MGHTSPVGGLRLTTEKREEGRGPPRGALANVRTHKDFRDSKINPTILRAENPGPSCRGLDFEAHEDVGRVDREGRGGDDGAADVHERVQELAEHGARFFEGEHEGGAFEAFVCEIEDSDDAVNKRQDRTSEADRCKKR